MTATTQLVSSQLFIIVTINFDECFYKSFSIRCNENELVGHLYEHFEISVDRYKPISLSTLIEWLNDENIVLDIFNDKGNKISSEKSETIPYHTKYILHDKLGNIVNTLTEEIVLKEYLIKFKESDIVENLDTPDEIQSACEKVWTNSARWSIVRLSDNEPFYATALNLP